MLPAENRMRRSAEFARAFRGVRGGTARVLVAIGGCPATCAAESEDHANNVADLPPKVGFVVPATVGNSVIRHRLYRQLRHIMRERIQEFVPGELVAVRAFPQARGATSSELAADVDRCIASARRRERKRKSGSAEKGELRDVNEEGSRE